MKDVIEYFKERLSDSKKFKLKALEVDASAIAVIIDRAISAESEVDELKAKLAHLENSLDETKRALNLSAKLNTRFLEEMHSMVTAPAQRITEQDARELFQRILDEGFTVGIYTEIKSLLDKLNEHREPEVKANEICGIKVFEDKNLKSHEIRVSSQQIEPVAYAFYTAAGDIRIWWSAKAYDIYSAKDWAKANRVDYSDLVSLYDHAPITANKAEVQNGEECFIGSRNVGKFVGLNPYSGSYVTVSEANEYRAFHDWQLGFAPLPPLKDGE